MPFTEAGDTCGYLGAAGLNELSGCGWYSSVQKCWKILVNLAKGAKI